MSHNQSFFPKIPKKNNKISLFEKTPTYYKSLNAQARIRAMNPDIKLILIGEFQNAIFFVFFPNFEFQFVITLKGQCHAIFTSITEFKSENFHRNVFQNWGTI